MLRYVYWYSAVINEVKLIQSFDNVMTVVNGGCAREYVITFYLH